MNERLEAGNQISRAHFEISKWVSSISGMNKEMQESTWFLSDKFIFAEITVNVNGTVQYDLKFRKHKKRPEKGMVDSVDEALDRISKYRGEYIEDCLSNNIKPVKNVEPIGHDEVFDRAMAEAKNNPQRLVELQGKINPAIEFIEAIAIDLSPTDPGKGFSRERGVGKWVGKLFDTIIEQGGSFTMPYKDTWQIVIPGLDITVQKYGVMWSIDVAHDGKAVEQFPTVTDGEMKNIINTRLNTQIENNMLGTETRLDEVSVEDLDQAA